MLECWFDGACEPVNPGGHAAYGALVKSGDTVLFAESRYVGHGPGISNNVAEYCGVIAVLEWLTQNAAAEVGTIYGDSQLVVNQLMGYYRAKQGLYVPYYEQAMALYGPLCQQFVLSWIPRELNEEADALSVGALRARNIVSRHRS